MIIINSVVNLLYCFAVLTCERRSRKTGLEASVEKRKFTINVRVTRKKKGKLLMVNSTKRKKVKYVGEVSEKNVSKN